MKRACLAGVSLAVALALAGPVAAAPSGARLEPALAATPAPVAVGGTIEVVLSVTNTGDVQASGVVPFLDVNDGAGLLGAPTGPLPAVPADLNPGDFAAFTWTFPVAGAGTVSFTGTVVGTDAVFLVPVEASAPASVAANPPAALVSDLAVVPGPAEAGQTIEVRLTTTNTGGFAATGVVPMLDVNDGAGLLGAPTGPLPAGPVDLNPGDATTFTWTFPATGAGMVAFTATGVGTESGLGGVIGAPASASATVLTPAALVGALAATPAPGRTGDWIAVVLTVTNTGQVAASTVTPASLGFAAGGSLVSAIGGPLPAGPVAIPGGASATFVWTVSASGCGTVAMNTSAAGTDAFTGAPVSAPGSVTLLLKGDPWDPTDDTAAGASLLAPAPGGTTHGPHALCPADAVDWYRLPLVAGRAYRIAALSGGGDSYAELFADAAAASMVASDDDSGGAFQFAIEGTAPATHDYWLKVRTVPAGGDWAGYVSAREMARASVAITTSPAMTGQAVQVVLTVTNTGNGTLNATTPALTITAGAGLLSLVSAPVPAAVAAGGSASFTWSFTVLAGGTVEFTASAAGTEAGTGVLRAVSGGGVLTALEPSSLAGASSAGPDPAAVGQWITIALTVTNTGGAAVNAVVPAIRLNAGGALLVSEGPVAPAGPVALAPGTAQTFRWTFSVSGSGDVGYTVTAAGTDAGTGAAAVVPSSGGLATLFPARLETAASLVPAQVEIGKTVTVVLTVTNTGGFAALGVAPALEANAGGGALSLVSGPVPAGPVTIAPGTRALFAWTWSVTGAGALVLTGTATGTDAATGRAIQGAGSVAGVAASPAGLVSRLTVSPSPVTTGQWIEVALTVTNEGGVNANAVAPVLAAAEGAGRVVAISGPVPPGPVTLVPGSGRTFVWSWSTSGSGPVVFSATATGTDAWTGLPLVTATSGVILLKGDAWDPGDDLATGGTLLTPGIAWQVHGPHALGGSDVADWYRVALVAGRAYRFESAGSGDAFGQLFADAAGTQSVAADDDGAGGFQFQADATTAATGVHYLKVTTVAVGGDWSGGLRYRQLLAASLAVSPAQPASGQGFIVVLTVTNTAGAVLNAPVLSLAPTAGGSLVDLVGSPAAPASIAAGGSASFTWTWSVNGAGTVAFEGAVVGTDAGTGRTLSAFASANLLGGTPAALSGSFTFSPSAPEPGMTVRTVLAVRNDGAYDATGVLPSLDINAGASVASLTAGPTPAGPVTIAPGATSSFTWTWSVDGAGTLAVTATAAGTGAVTGTSAVLARSLAVPVAAPPKLVSRVDVAPSSVVMGQWITVTLTVTNEGAGGASAISPELRVNTGSALVDLKAGPVPAGPVAIAAGTARTFAWTFSTTGAGAIEFTATAAGTDSWTGTKVGVSATGGLSVSAPALLVATISPGYPYEYVVGRMFEMVVTVRNAGGVAASGVTVVVGPDVCATLVAFPGPSPTAPATLAPGAQASYTWTFSATGKGFIGFSATASGTDAVTGFPLRAFSWSSLSSINRSMLSGVLELPGAPVVEGDVFNPIFVVTNNGDRAAYVGSVSLVFDDPSAAQVSAQFGSYYSYIPAGGSVSYQWHVTAMRKGTPTARARLTGQDSYDGSAVTASAQGTVAIAEKFSEDLVAWPNPASSWLNVAVKLDETADEVRVEVYNAAFKRLTEQVWRLVSPGAGAQLPVYGIQNWAPGIYLLRAKVTYPRNRVTILAPVKVAVKR